MELLGADYSTLRSIWKSQVYIEIAVTNVLMIWLSGEESA